MISLEKFVFDGGTMKRWCSDKSIGNIKRILYKIMKKIYRFSDWHVEPINFRPYALEIIKRLSKENFNNPVVELGCGLGEIINEIDCNAIKYGFDINLPVLKATKILHPKVLFINGTFGDVEVGKIDCCIMVNFTHVMEENYLQEEINSLISKNEVNMFVIDTLKNSKKSTYKYEHKSERLFPNNFKLKYSRYFKAACGARRCVEYWVKIGE